MIAGGGVGVSVGRSVPVGCATVVPVGKSVLVELEIGVWVGIGVSGIKAGAMVEMASLSVSIEI
jgi:hypothetical protein